MKKVFFAGLLLFLSVVSFAQQPAEYEGGKLYNPSDGNSYSLNAKLKTENELHFRGYFTFRKNNEV
ncbi:MAG TPA: hypothetical protein DCM71_27040 [Runella sp.]|nr:hypothetical protein [Runella sp.]